MNNCCTEQIFPYKVVRSINERNSIPCDEREEGMIVTVINLDKSFEQYILIGKDVCVNKNWIEYNKKISLKDFILHKTIENKEVENITKEYLNSKFPETQEGFRVTVKYLNTTFLKIENNNWVMVGNNILE